MVKLKLKFSQRLSNFCQSVAISPNLATLNLSLNGAHLLVFTRCHGGGGDSLEGHHPFRRRNPSFSFSSPRPSKTSKSQGIHGKSLFGGGGGGGNEDDDWKDI